jgi:pimeloyl-ACP methyl ester carboxylesterase
MNQTLFRVSLLAIIVSSICVTSVARADDSDSAKWFDRQTLWNGYEQFHFKVAERAAYVVAPKKPAVGNPWVWRARFPGYHADMDVALLGRGFHIAYVDVAGLFGSPQAVKIGDRFYDYMTNQRGLHRKVVLEGVSRGGLFVYNWAVDNTDKVACIYCDTPVLDFKSWPGGKGKGVGSVGAWQQCLKAYGFSAKQGENYDSQPVDKAAIFAKAKIPILHIVSESDRVVPPPENTYLLKRRLEEQGHALDVISVAKGTAKSNGHHFDHPDPDRVVNFVLQHATTKAQ